MKVSTLLFRAARRIETKGWTRGVYNNHGRCCAMGAMYAVAPPGCLSSPLVTSASRALAEELALNGCDRSVVGYNDQVAESKWDVINLMRKVARKLRNKERLGCLT